MPIMKCTTTQAARLIPAAICAVPLLACGGQTSTDNFATFEQSPGAWEFRIEPYGWFTAIDGTTGPTANAAELDASFSDILDVLEMAAALQLEVRNGRWGIIGDAFYAELGTSGTSNGPLQTDVSVDFEQFLGELDVFYRVSECQQGFVDLYAGFRYNDLTLDVAVSGEARDASRSADKDWADPIIGARTQWNINDRWFLAAKGDIGGFGVSSDFTWNLQGSVGFNITESVSVEAGYRYFDTDYQEDGFTYDVAQSGVILGLNIRF